MSHQEILKRGDHSKFLERLKFLRLCICVYVGITIQIFDQSYLVRAILWSEFLEYFYYCIQNLLNC